MLLELLLSLISLLRLVMRSSLVKDFYDTMILIRLEIRSGAFFENQRSWLFILRFPFMTQIGSRRQFGSAAYLILQRRSVPFCSAKVAWVSTLAVEVPFCGVVLKGF